MGFSGKDVRNIFLTQAFIIGIIGAITGLGLGYGISSLVHRVPFRVAGMTTLPIDYQVIDFVLAVVFGIVTTIIAGYLPSCKASRIDPVVIIRG
jgi:lipoprotein-releasing system permease protein